jgi:hypothetical protein
MPIHVDWDDAEQTIIRYTFSSPWTWNDYRAAIDRAWELAQSVDHPTDTITDMSNSRLWPEGLFTNIRKSVVEIPDTTQSVVLVGGGMFVEMSISVLRRVYRSPGARFLTAHSLDEARQLILQRRAEKAG